MVCALCILIVFVITNGDTYKILPTLFICWKYLTSIAYKFNNENFKSGLEEINDQIKNLGKFSYEEKSAIQNFLLAPNSEKSVSLLHLSSSISIL